MKDSFDLKEMAIEKMEWLKECKLKDPLEPAPSLVCIIPIQGEILLIPGGIEQDDISSTKIVQLMTACMAKKIGAIAVLYLHDSKAINVYKYMFDVYNIDIKNNPETLESARKLFEKDFERYGMENFPIAYRDYGFQLRMMGPNFEPFTALQIYRVEDGKVIFEPLDDKNPLGTKEFVPPWWGKIGAELPNIPDKAIRKMYPGTQEIKPFSMKDYIMPITGSESIN